MEPPQLRCAEAPMRTSLGAPVPMFVDESVGNIRIQECQELGGASRRKRRVHGPANYSLKLYLSAKSGEQHISHTTCLLHVTYTETRNTLFYSFKGGVGRSLALLNAAYTLAGRGRHVLVVDMDLEAPGISSFLLGQK